MRTTALITISLALVACGTESTDSSPTTSEEREPSSETTPDETTPETTEPLDVAESLADAIGRCRDDDDASALAREEFETAAQAGPDYVRSLASELAADDGVTEDEWFDMAWKEIWTPQSDGSLVLSSINETYDGIEYDHLEPYDDTITVVGAYTAAAFDCVSSLIPARVTNAMGQTRALDGRQTADWDGMAAEWSYHPNSGMSVVLYETD